MRFTHGWTVRKGVELARSHAYITAKTDTLPMRRRSIGWDKCPNRRAMITDSPLFSAMARVTSPRRKPPCLNLAEPFGFRLLFV